MTSESTSTSQTTSSTSDYSTTQTDISDQVTGETSTVSQIISTQPLGEPIARLSAPLLWLYAYNKLIARSKRSFYRPMIFYYRVFPQIR